MTNAAKAVASYIKLGPGRAILTENVDYVEAVDNGGLLISETKSQV
jgi:hypothetical protein